MNTASRRKALRLNKQTSELMSAAPQVVAHRLTRMALAGHQPSASDRREFHQMGAEKVAAFGESWQAMAMQMLKAQPHLAASLMRSWWPSAWPGAWPLAWPASLPKSGKRGAAKTPVAPAVAAAWQSATLDILTQGLLPVHRRATANARRLARKRR